MGMFNYVHVDCPSCGSIVEFQSKSGSCTLDTYHITDLPVDELAGIIDDQSQCPNCGFVVAIKEPAVIRRENFSHLVY